MIKSNEIAVVKEASKFMYNIYACNKDKYLNSKGKSKARFVDLVVGQFEQALIDMDCQEFILVTPEGKNYLCKLH